MKKESADAPPTAADAHGPARPGTPLEVSPYKSAVEELDALRKTFRAVCQEYAKRIDMDIIRVRERVAAAGEQQQKAEAAASGVGGKARGGAAAGRARANVSPGNARMFDLRDMLTLLRTLELKPHAGRRKDLKKVESLVDDLRLLVERWE